MALLRLCARYARRQPVSLFAFTVDHGLRAESSKEAAQVRDWCNRLGVAHTTLHWEGRKPATGVQAAARSARYRLLVDAANAHDCGALLTAHTQDDQAETLFMRLARGAGVDGLSAMKREMMVAAGPGAPLRLLRPLLDVSRSSLTDYLGGRDQDFIDDPSNDDPAFERIRIRALLAALGEQDIVTAPKLSETARKMQAAQTALRRNEDALLQDAGGLFYSWGGVSLTRWPQEAPGAGGLARRLIHAVSGAEYPPGEDDAAEAVANARLSGAATLSGAMVKQWKNRLWFLREPAALLGRAGVAADRPASLAAPRVWDRRFIVTPNQPGLAAGPCGEAVHDVLGSRARLFRGPPEALAALPGLFVDDALTGVLSIPILAEWRAGARSLVEERYRGGIVRFL